METGLSCNKRNLDLRKSIYSKDSGVLGWSGERMVKVLLESILDTYLSEECLRLSQLCHNFRVGHSQSQHSCPSFQYSCSTVYL